MSYIKVCQCDTCKDTINPFDEDKYRTGYRHMCRKCQIKEYGFVVSEQKEFEEFVKEQTDE